MSCKVGLWEEAFEMTLGATAYGGEVRSEGELGKGSVAWVENDEWVAERRWSRRRGGLGRLGRDSEMSVSLDESDMRLL